jgi:AraC-like DNA-binding protein
MPFNPEAVKHFVCENIKSIRGENDVARHFGKSVETIRKDFSRNGRVNLSYFISDVRLETMKRLLEETNLPCKEVCFEAGFRREDTGSKFFKRKTTMTMTEYRRKTQNPKQIPP